MKLFVAGASGAMGKRLVPQLVANGYEVVALTRSEGKAGALRALGAEVVVADALDRTAMMQAVMRAEPESEGRERVPERVCQSEHRLAVRSSRSRADAHRRGAPADVSMTNARASPSR